MAEENRITTPSGSAGIVRFYDVSASRVQIDPKLVVGFSAFLIVVELAFAYFAK